MVTQALILKIIGNLRFFSFDLTDCYFQYQELALVRKIIDQYDLTDETIPSVLKYSTYIITSIAANPKES